MRSFSDEKCENTFLVASTLREYIGKSTKYGDYREGNIRRAIKNKVKHGPD